MSPSSNPLWDDPSDAGARTLPEASRVGGEPDPRLHSYLVGEYVGWSRRPGRAAPFVVPAHTAVQLVLKVEDSALRPPEFVHGPATAPSNMDGACAAVHVQVDLTPLGAYRILGIPLDRIAGRLVDLADLLGPGGARLGDAVRDAGAWPERFAAVDEFLVDRAQVAPLISNEVDYAWHRIVNSGGAVPIQVLCREIGWTHKHLLTRFREQVGVSPKRAARLVRFERALRRSGTAGATTGDPIDWARLAIECGYSDQAHLIREFKEFTGTTPGAAPAELAG